MMDYRTWRRSELAIWAYLCERVSAMHVESDPAVAKALHRQQRVAQEEMDRRDHAFLRDWTAGRLPATPTPAHWLAEQNAACDRFVALMNILEHLIRRTIDHA